MPRTIVTLAGVAVGLGVFGSGALRAETIMQQCGQQYQAQKVAGTLNGMNWSQFRTECAARLKAQPASMPAGGPPAAVAPAGATVEPAPAPAGATATNPGNPLKPPATAPAPASPAPISPAPSGTAPKTAPVSGGRAAMLNRERQCGAEWRADKVSLVAKMPGLTWPKYWSQCNTRLKAAGQ